MKLERWAGTLEDFKKNKKRRVIESDLYFRTVALAAEQVVDW